MADVEEQQIEITTQNQEEYYLGKKKKHTLKNQIIALGITKRIINVFRAKGTVHDFQMLRNSNVIQSLEDKKPKGCLIVVIKVFKSY